MTEAQEVAEVGRGQSVKRPALVATGGLLGALAAASCCLLPLALFGLGVTGAWIGALSSLAPYQPIFVAVTACFLGAGFWMVYRTPKAAGAEGAYCVRPIVSTRIVKSALWTATGLVAAAAAFPYLAPFLLEG